MSRLPRAMEAGSATVIAVGIVAAFFALSTVVIGVSQLLHLSQRLQSAADLASLAASDVSLGVAPGQPCVVARAILSRATDYQVSCELVESNASITLSTQWWGMTVSRTSRAGPHPTPPWSDHEYTS
jgi:secretion/DNA translocation related TadE-like protein